MAVSQYASATPAEAAARLDDLERRFSASPDFESDESFGGGVASQDYALPEVDDSPTVRLTRLASAGADGSVKPSAGAESVRMRFMEWSQRYVIALIVIDAVIGAISTAIPAVVSNTLSARGWATIALFALVGTVVWPATVAFARGYQRRGVGFGSDELRAVLRAGVAVVMAGALPAGLLQEQALLKLAVVAAPAAVTLSLAARYAARKLLHRRQARGHNVRHIVVAGSSAAARELWERLDREPHGGMKVIGVCVPRAELPRVVDMGMPVLGDLHQVASVVKKYGCDAVAVTSDDATRFNYLRELSWSLEGTGVEMLVDPGLVEVAGPRMHIRPLMGFPLLHIEEPHFTGWRRLFKRTFDVALTSIGLVLISPLLLVVAAVIKFQDGGPVIFRQTRVGRAGELFTMYKFRSMVIDAEERKAELSARNQGKGGLFKLDDDPRITPFGKFIRAYSIDELPQLLNVMNGTMSLVGPRPHLAHELASMPSHSSRRALVTPGLTGLWQISGRSHLDGDDAIRLDLRYVENWSLTMDLLILWKTASAVLARRGAS